MSSNKLKMYEKAYNKCIKDCDMKSGNCKTKCKSPFLKLNLKLKSPKKSPSQKLNAYQKFVKKEYPKHKNLDRKDIFKAIAEKWNDKKH